eukprot:GHVQ01023617.1.p1 GENE.GHVQ01023617.1~~GHVQ01023617.1.p1  ORF type:complete len:378 (+),score=36.22 GHVQ01023617.1:931-2064(+)
MTLVSELKGHTGDVKDCSVSSDSQTVASCASDNTFRLWDVKSGRLLHSQELANPKNKSQKLIFRCCSFVNLPGRSRSTLLTLACGHRGPSYAIKWNLEMSTDRTSATVRKCSETWIDKQPCCALAASDDRQYFAVGFVSGACKVFNAGFSCVRVHELHGLPITGIVFVNGNKTVLSSGADYSIATMTVVTPWSLGSCCWSLTKTLCLTVLSLLLLFGCYYALNDAAVTGLHLLTNSTNNRRDTLILLQEYVDSLTEKATAHSPTRPPSLGLQADYPDAPSTEQLHPPSPPASQQHHTDTLAASQGSRTPSAGEAGVPSDSTVVPSDSTVVPPSGTPGTDIGASNEAATAPQRDPAGSRRVAEGRPGGGRKAGGTRSS